MSTTEISLLRQELLPLFRGALDFVAAQAERIIATYPGYSPMYTVGGKWNREGERWTHWCEGFFPGILWLLHQHTGAAKWRTWAEQYSRPLEPRQYDRNVHDLGFIFGWTYFPWLQLTGDFHLRDVLIQAGRTLALRRQKGGYLASFMGTHSLFIDIMMNVWLIRWAAMVTGGGKDDPELWKIAWEHCRVTAETLVRADGSTAHEGIFDVETGQFLHQSTQQGWKPESTWSRGQAWALYGFTTMAWLEEPNSQGAIDDFLYNAKRCADFWLRRAPAGSVPLWDFDVPDDGKQPFDSSAAAIACSGLLSLATRLSDSRDGYTPDGDRYRYTALKTLETLCSDLFLARAKPEWEGILMHGVYHKHKALGVDESVAWGDFFFVEALVKAVGKP